jgi:hypothetical protein
MSNKKRTAHEAWGEACDNIYGDNDDNDDMLCTYDRPDKVQKAPPRPETIVMSSEFWSQATKDIYMHYAAEY